MSSIFGSPTPAINQLFPAGCMVEVQEAYMKYRKRFSEEAGGKPPMLRAVKDEGEAGVSILPA